MQFKYMETKDILKFRFQKIFHYFYQIFTVKTRTFLDYCFQIKVKVIYRLLKYISLLTLLSHIFKKVIKILCIHMDYALIKCVSCTEKIAPLNFVKIGRNNKNSNKNNIKGCILLFLFILY